MGIGECYRRAAKNPPELALQRGIMAPSGSRADRSGRPSCNPVARRGHAIGDSAVFLFVGLVLFVLAAISEWRRRRLGEAASPFQARAPLVIGLCGLIDVVLGILLRLG